jgi:phosphatidylethanolamine-binding protein (PEBP) family uncharacterized protein
MSAPVSNPNRPALGALTVLTAVVAALVLLLTACGTSGRELREPERDVTAPTRSVPTTVASISLPPLPLGTGSTVATFPAVAPGVFDIASSAFPPGSDIPVANTCAGPSPALRWQGVPEGTTELALVVTQPDDGGDVHWIVTGIAPTDGEVAEGAVPVGGIQLTNSLGAATWSAPCPPPGERVALNFVLLALTQPASIPAGTPATDAYRLLSEQAAGKIAILTSAAVR